jgi:hypothetical protein
LLSKRGIKDWSVLATLNRILGTVSEAIRMIKGNIVLLITSGPTTEAKPYDIRCKKKMKEAIE